jgi:hypothetical protein
MLLSYMTKGSNVHGNAIWGICTGAPPWHFYIITHLENSSYLVVQGDVKYFVVMGHVGSQYPPKTNGSEQQWCQCPGNRLPNNAAHLHLAGKMWWMIKLLNDGQQGTHWGTHSERQVCNFMAYGIWPWFMLLHCATHHGGCVIIPKGLCQMGTSCINWQPETGKNDIACVSFLLYYAVKQKKLSASSCY